MSQLVPLAELPSGKKIYNVRGQKFEVDKNYVLQKVVGFGAYGTVCSAICNDTGDRVAIKRLSRVFEDLREGKRILREMEIMTSLRHTNLIHLRQIIRPQAKETFEDIYLVMDLYDTDLNRIIRSRQKLTDEHLQYFMIQSFRGLHYLHSAKVMHRDLKPSNLLVNADCALAICDFGLARDDQVVSASDLTQYVVTRWYRPPEVLGMGFNQYSSAVDVWSLGLIFAELLVGRTLLPGTDYIGQLVMIVNLLGSPSTEDMEFLSAEAKSFILAQPRRAGVPFKDLFSMATPEAIDLLSKLLVFHPAKRLTAKQVMEHPYFEKFRDSAAEADAPDAFTWNHSCEYTKEQLRDELWRVRLRRERLHELLAGPLQIDMPLRVRRPREPAPGECCGSGCTRCVWDMYYDELAKYEDLKSRGAVDEDENSMSSSESDNEPISYIGSVVVKYVDQPTGMLESSQSRWEKAELQRRGFHTITAVDLLSRSSGSDFPSAEPAICVVNIHTSDPVPQPLPGDTVEVFVPNTNGTNAPSDVAALCRVLDVNPKAWCVLHRSPFVPEDNFPPWLPLEQPLTVEELLTYYVDISSCSYLLHPSFFESLLRLYKNSKGRPKSEVSTESSTNSLGTPELLEECASIKNEPQAFRYLANNGNPLCYPCLVDVLEVFSFVKMPLDRLLEVSGPLRARKFSVASFSGEGDSVDSMQLCIREVCAQRRTNLRCFDGKEEAIFRFAKVLNDIASSRNVKHSSWFLGHASHPLCKMASPCRYGGCIGAPPTIYLGSSLFGNSRFSQNLQKSCQRIRGLSSTVVRSPLLLVGCGTGIAPLIAAVSQLMHYRASVPPDTHAYPCWVFYGGRSRSELVYDSLLNKAMQAGAIAKYEYSLSRMHAEGQNGERVTDALSCYANFIKSTLSEGGEMFVCGPGKALRSVRQLLETKLLSEVGDDESIQEQRVLLLEEKGQLSFDVWSTANIFD